MYTRTKRIISNTENISNYIEGYDIYNSTLLNKLLDPEIEREVYIIQGTEFRPDLIATKYYGDQSYMGLVIIQSRLNLSSFKDGSEIMLIPKKVLDTILNKIE